MFASLSDQYDDDPRIVSAEHDQAVYHAILARLSPDGSQDPEIVVPVRDHSGDLGDVSWYAIARGECGHRSGED